MLSPLISTIPGPSVIAIIANSLKIIVKTVIVNHFKTTFILYVISKLFHHIYHYNPLRSQYHLSNSYTFYYFKTFKCKTI